MKTTDPFSQHEALDRAHLIAEAFERQIADHPFIRAHPDLAARCAAISEALGVLYQAIGAVEVAGLGPVFDKTPVAHSDMNQQEE